MGLMHWLADRLAPRPRGPGSTLMPHDLPPVHAHWLTRHVHPMLHEAGVAGVDGFFEHFLRDSARRTGTTAPRFLSLGSGNGTTELRLAAALVADGVHDFTIECVEADPLLQSGARASALARGLDQHLVPVRRDPDTWKARDRYDGVLADGSLHGVVRLERVLDEVRRALADGAWFVVSARIGRNGHRRWPEALDEVRRLFDELPASHRWNHQLRRHEQVYQDQDARRVGDDGVRAQDVLPLLLQRFSLPVFVGYANLVEPFVGPAFGPNFSPNDPWSRGFIADVHARDEARFQEGALTPTRLLAVLSREDEPVRCHARGLSPERCVRTPVSD